MIRLEHIYKIFGPNPSTVLMMVDSNSDRDAIQEKTGHVVALNDISLTINDGEIFVIMGLSGSGKSTLIRCINRLIEPTSGNIFVDGVDVLKLGKKELIQFRRHRLAMIFQSFAVLPFRSVYDNVKFGLEVQGVSKDAIKERVMITLKTVGLERWKDAFPNQLSGGMLQRVGTARALVNEPDILLMDEPFSALDPIIRCHMQDELMDLQAKVSKTIIFITHDLNEAIKVGNRCAILRNGKVVQIGTGLELLTKPADDFVVDFSRDIDRCTVLRVSDLMIDPSSCTISLQKDLPETALNRMLEHQIFFAFVIEDSTGDVSSLRGMVSLESVKAAVQEDKSSLTGMPLMEIPKQAIARSWNSIKEICGVLNYNTGSPVLVVNPEGRIIGALTPRSLCTAIGDRSAPLG